MAVAGGLLNFVGILRTRSRSQGADSCSCSYINLYEAAGQGDAEAVQQVLPS